jgi:hypothetical protein
VHEKVIKRNVITLLRQKNKNEGGRYKGMGKSKPPVPKEVVNELLRMVIGYELEEIEGRSFTVEELKTRGTVEEYKTKKMNEKLGKYMVISRCRRLTKAMEELTEKDMIPIIRSVVREQGYQVIGAVYENEKPYRRRYIFEKYKEEEMEEEEGEE